MDTARISCVRIRYEGATGLLILDASVGGSTGWYLVTASS